MLRPIIAFAVVLLLGFAEIAIFAHCSGHSIAHVASLGAVPDTRHKPAD